MTHWRLDAGPSSLVFAKIRERLALVYFGARLSRDFDPTALTAAGAPITPHGELDVEPERDAFPSENGIAHLQAAVRARRGGHALLIDLRLNDASQHAGALHFELSDLQSGVTLDLHIEGTESGVYRSRSSLSNRGDSTLAVDWLASLHLLLPAGHQELLRFGGFWANELKAERVPLGRYSVVIENHRGRSSHQSFPALISGTRGFSESEGEVLLTALEWSGNHALRVEPAPTGGHQLQAGVPLQAGEIDILPGASWTTPAALFARAANGMNALRGQFARHWRQQKSGRQYTRPIHFNSWEASYFTHDQHSTRSLIDAAKALGAERFVLDDGWMQGRSGPGYGLGDWRPCPERYPEGLRPIAEHARNAGLDFGLWIEPEMATPDSEVASTHPDWVIQIPGRETISGRQQYLLDITLPAVREHLLACIDRLIADSAPGYLKWDMNRDYAQLGFGVTPGSTAMTESWYTLVNEVRRRHPNLCIESCAAGGARNDAGAMVIADRLWLSDSMDPLQRFTMLRHASLLLPPPRLGTHIGASPSATSAATLPLSTRCIVALLGHMGIELKPDTLGDEEKRTLKQWLSFYRLNRDWLALADYHYLDSTEIGLNAVLVIDDSAGRGLLLVLRDQYPTQAQPPLIKLPALSDTATYQLELLNPQDCDYVQGAIPWHRGELISITGEALRTGGLRAPYLRYGHCALISLSSLQS